MSKGIVSWLEVTRRIVDYVDHPELQGGKTRGHYIGKYPALPFFLFKVPRKECELCEYWILKNRINKEIDFIPDH